MNTETPASDEPAERSAQPQAGPAATSPAPAVASGPDQGPAGTTSAPNTPAGTPGADADLVPAAGSVDLAGTAAAGFLSAGGDGQVPGDPAAMLAASAYLTPPPEPGPSLRSRIGVGAALAIVIALLGYPLGWLWSSVAPWIPAEVLQHVAYLADPEGEQIAGAESWFIVLSLGAGVVIGIATWLLLRRYRGSLTLVALALGSSACGWLAWRFGHNIGRGHARELVRTVKDGTIIQVPPDLRIRSTGNVARWHGMVPYIAGDLLYVAVAAVAIYWLIVMLHASPSLSIRRARPSDPTDPTV